MRAPEIQDKGEDTRKRSPSITAQDLREESAAGRGRATVVSEMPGAGQWDTDGLPAGLLPRLWNLPGVERVDEHRVVAGHHGLGLSRRPGREQDVRHVLLGVRDDGRRVGVDVSPVPQARHQELLGGQDAAQRRDGHELGQAGAAALGHDDDVLDRSGPQGLGQRAAGGRHPRRRVFVRDDAAGGHQEQRVQQLLCRFTPRVKHGVRGKSAKVRMSEQNQRPYRCCLTARWPPRCSRSTWRPARWGTARACCCCRRPPCPRRAAPAPSSPRRRERCAPAARRSSWSSP